MKRRDFGLLAGTSLASAAVLRPAKAATADPTLLTTTLTPLGATRAGNADGSIPAWTGGLVSPPLDDHTSVQVRLFEDEQPLYTVDASNMDQYADMLTEATKFQIKNYGRSLKVYPTHRTAAAPQYVYDNAAKNVTRGQLDPRGGRFGFTGAVGGPPFPIIDESDPLTAGSQIIWNKLTAWYTYADYSTANPGGVVIGGQITLVAATRGYFIYPYYAPDVTPENYQGYFSMLHVYDTAPGNVVGQESLVWHTTNVNIKPDIVWTLLNGQGRIRKAPNEAFDSPNPEGNGISNIDESQCFYGNPSQYNWTSLGKKEMLIPYNCNKIAFHTAQELCLPKFFNPDIVRWEKHRVWVLEANLAPGNHNVNVKRHYYVDEDTWWAVLGEGYDANGNMVKAYHLYLYCVPSYPGTVELAESVQSLITGDYTFDGDFEYAPYVDVFTNAHPSPSIFEPEQMAAQASF